MSLSKVPSFCGSTFTNLITFSQVQCLLERIMNRPVTPIDVLMFSTIISIFLTDQTVMAVPANNHVTGTNSRIVPEGPEFWTTPCGEPVVDEYDPTLSDAEVAATFALELDIELNNVNQWKDNYCNARFLWSFDEQVESDQHYRYDWLEVNAIIPKQPGEALNQSYYMNQKLNSMLTDSSNLLQRIAIAWEQVAIEKTDSQFKDQFEDTKYRMITTLCTLDIILAQKGLSPTPNLNRNIMPDELRSMTSASGRDERNFRILKEYVVTLEYYGDGFGYLKEESK